MVSRLSPIPPARTCSTYRKASTSPCPATSLRSVPASRRRTTTTGYSRGRRRTGRGREGGGPAVAPVAGQAASVPDSPRAPAGARGHGRFRWVVLGVAAVLVAGG